MIVLHFEEAKQNLEYEKCTNLCYFAQLNLTHFPSLRLDENEVYIFLLFIPCQHNA